MVAPLPAASVDNILRLMKLYAIDPCKLFDENLGQGLLIFPGQEMPIILFLVESDGELLGIIKLQVHMKVFRLDSEGNMPEPVKSTRNCAIFNGYRRCISVSTDKFQSVVANCVYYVKSTDSSLDIHKYDLITERVCEAIDSLNPITLSFASPPFTVVQLLSSYTINVGESNLAMDRFKLQAVEMERLKQQDPRGGFLPLSFPQDFSFPDLNLDDDEVYD